MRRVVIFVVALACLTTAAHAEGPGLGLGQFGNYEEPQQAYAWQGQWTSKEVRFPSARTGAMLYGVFFSPKRKPTTRLPAVVIVPGSGTGVQSFYHWAARDLAGHGYIALAVDPQGVGRSETFGTPACAGATTDDPCPGVPWQQAVNYVDAFVSGMNFVVRDRRVDTKRIGLAGHSLAARAASWLQGPDRRVDAIVAWDNLASALEGDAGSSSGGPPLSAVIGGEVPTLDQHPVTPRVPALGMASDFRGTAQVYDDDPDQKKTAYSWWRRHRRPAMELVFQGAGHLNWAQTRLRGDEAQLRMFAYYTRAWFDRFLRGDRAATARLLARRVLGQARSAFLSDIFRSAAWMDGYRSEDLRAS